MDLTTELPGAITTVLGSLLTSFILLVAANLVPPIRWSARLAIDTAIASNLSDSDAKDAYELLIRRQTTRLVNYRTRSAFEQVAGGVAVFLIVIWIVFVAILWFLISGSGGTILNLITGFEVPFYIGAFVALVYLIYAIYGARLPDVSADARSASSDAGQK